MRAAAKLIGISKSTLYRRLAAGKKLPSAQSLVQEGP
ncbi:MAG: hypothetical protein LBS10_00830 [Gracilibacteraceae bacterium]|nr:hypothetical protein [Gracilibacteraceae bacterium]